MWQKKGENRDEICLIISDTDVPVMPFGGDQDSKQCMCTICMCFGLGWPSVGEIMGYPYPHLRCLTVVSHTGAKGLNSHSGRKGIHVL